MLMNSEHKKGSWPSYSTVLVFAWKDLLESQHPTPFLSLKMITFQIQVRGFSFCANLLGAGEFTLSAPGILKVAVKSLIHWYNH